MILVRHLRRNTGWKIASVLIATVAWWLIGAPLRKDRTDQEQRGVQASKLIDAIPVHLTKAAWDTNRYRIDPQSVQVKVQGDAFLLDRLQRSDIRVGVDLSAPPPAASQWKPLEWSKAGSSSGRFEIVEVEPQGVLVEVEGR